MPSGTKIRFAEARRTSAKDRVSTRAAVFPHQADLAVLRRPIAWTAGADAKLWTSGGSVH